MFTIYYIKVMKFVILAKFSHLEDFCVLYTT